MLRSSRMALLAMLLLGACATWAPVPVPVKLNPSAVADPEKEIKTLLNMLSYPPAFIEVTDQYIKAVWAGSTGVLLFAKVADLRVLVKGDVFQVSAYDAKNNEFFAYRPATHDFPTCERFVNAFYALTKRTPPPAPAAAKAAN